jgi:hypothetical protein
MLQRTEILDGSNFREPQFLCFNKLLSRITASVTVDDIQFLREIVRVSSRVEVRV